MAGEPRTIGRYTLGDMVGRGGFGAVYRATDVDHGRDVAVKLLQGALGEAERRRFDRERQTMGRLGSHPNIVPVHDSGYTDDGEAYIVMELATGGSLRGRLERDGSLPWPEAVAIMADIANATSVAHASGVLHRDIKPDNILIDEYGNPKLSDFGIAVVANNATATTSTTATIAHAAPELLQGQPSTEAVDIYAIGSTLHNLIAGSPPFVRPGDELVTALITRALTEPPPDLRPLGVPDAVASVIERALAKAPESRQPTASQLAEQLVSSSTATGPPSTAPGPAAAQTVVANPAVGNPAQPATGSRPEPAQPTAMTPPSFPPPATPVDGVSGLGGSPMAQDNDGPRRGSRAVWVVVAALAAAVVILGAILVATGGDDGSPGDAADVTSAGQEQTAESPDEQATTTSSTTVETTSAESATTTSASASTTTSTAAPIVERDLTATATAFASSSAPSGNDACGEITTFDADNVLDGRRTTAWRTSGNGQGEVLEFAFSQSQSIVSVGLVPGYAKLDVCDGADRFYENRRITEVEWVIGDSVVTQQLNPDQPDMQVLRLDEPVEAEVILMTIISTTASGGRDFTAVSDVEIVGG